MLIYSFWNWKITNINSVTTFKTKKHITHYNEHFREIYFHACLAYKTNTYAFLVPCNYLKCMRTELWNDTTLCCWNYRKFHIQFIFNLTHIYPKMLLQDEHLCHFQYISQNFIFKRFSKPANFSLLVCVSKQTISALTFWHFNI